MSTGARLRLIRLSRLVSNLCSLEASSDDASDASLKLAPTPTLCASIYEDSWLS